MNAGGERIGRAPDGTAGGTPGVAARATLLNEQMPIVLDSTVSPRRREIVDGVRRRDVRRAVRP